ncbi:formimidoylglutamate deiminase [Ohtaekwangia sp.]|uniref:formimidoylglutamate deiminase n=1 Tax=Ohtaekwangia sp. TaxID=2066019 RepID=UPI002FDDA7E9
MHSYIKYYQFKGMLLSERWLSPGFVGVDEAGVIKYISDIRPQAAAIEAVQGYALPGFQNAHSHAFQYAMAGMAERHAPGAADDFWSWREAMYHCALSLDPDQVEAVAAMLYAEMLRKGYTHVAEFHYLHHDKDGQPYSNLSEMGERLIAAATTAGINITLIPVFYQKGGFGKEPQPRQRRFISPTVDDYFHLLDDSATLVANHSQASLGFSVHSLRAVDAKDILSTFEQGPKIIPFHLHAAEQLKEVEDCVAYLKQHPIEWLLNNFTLDGRFHIVHCTHMTDEETTSLAKSGAHAVLCPGTEGNLGDGIFNLTKFAQQGGSWSIGTDSHISLNPLEDLRWLDYAQRFTTHKRNTFDDGARVLFERTLLAGRKAMGNSQKEYFAINAPFDAVVYNAKSPLIAQASTNNLLPAILYTSDASDVLGTIVHGRWIVKNQHHAHTERITSNFLQAVKRLTL